MDIGILDKLPAIVLDHFHVGLSLVDANDGRILYANREFTRILGYPLAELIDSRTTFFDLTHPDDRTRNANEHARLLAGEICHYSLDKRYLQKSGTVLWAHVRISAIRNAAGAVEWAAGAIEDVSRARPSTHRPETAEDIAGVATWNLAIHPAATTSPSHSTRPSPPTSPEFDRWRQRIHPDDQQAAEKTLQRALARKTGFIQDYRVVQADGETHWVREVASCIYDGAGNVTNLIGATLDVTELKARQARGRSPRTLRDVIAHIEVNWNKPLSVSEIARQNSISPRSIHKHFADKGTTPMGFVKRLRLQHARTKLLNPTSRTSVTGVALECGFSNLGHFAKDYRIEFGELPSETLRNYHPQA
jgi:PAS domain S-box-containing protein